MSFKVTLVLSQEDTEPKMSWWQFLLVALGGGLIGSVVTYLIIVGMIMSAFRR